MSSRAIPSGGKTTAAVGVTNDLFEPFEVVTGNARRQTVLPGFFLDGATAELVVVNIDHSDNRRVQMFSFDGADWVSVLEATLRPEALFVDVANIAGRDRLITYESGRLSWFDPDSAMERMLVEVTTHFNATGEGEIPHCDITRDVNGDGLDDLLVPDVDGFWIAVQRRDGSFTEAMKIGPPEPFLEEAGLDDSGLNPSRSYGGVGITTFTFPLYLNRVHEMDFNQDGRNDLVFWKGDHFAVHLQEESGLFDPVAQSATIDVPIDSDGTYSRMFDFSEQGAFSLLFGFNENTERTVLHSLRDMNGDLVADLVTLTLSGRSSLRQRSRYDVHFGTTTPTGIAFARDAGASIEPKGRAGAGEPWGYATRWFEDFDGDGQVDLLLRDVTIGFGGMLRALVANSVGIDLELYRMDGGTYPVTPNDTRKIRTRGNLFRRSAPYLPAVLLGDVNGDGRADLLTGRREELHVFLGVPGPDMFARRPQKVAVLMPTDGEYARLVDLNKDGQRDVLLQHRSATEPNRVTLLIAR